MDEIFAIVVALIHWRLVVSMLGSVALALVLSNAIAAFTAPYCITLAMWGAAFGVIWQGRANAGLRLSDKIETPAISKPFAWIGLAFIGLVAGGVLATLFDSWIVGGGALLISTGIVTAWFCLTQRRFVPLRSMMLALFAVLSGYVCWLLLAAWATL